MVVGLSATHVFAGGYVYTAVRNGNFSDPSTWISSNHSAPVPITNSNAVININGFAVVLDVDYKVASYGSITVTGNGSLKGSRTLYLGSGVVTLNTNTTLKIDPGCSVRVKELRVHRACVKVAAATALAPAGALTTQYNMVLYNATFSDDGDTRIEGNCDRLGTPVCGKGQLRVRGKMYVRACKQHHEESDRNATSTCSLALCVQNQSLSDCAGPATSHEFDGDDEENSDEEETSCAADSGGPVCRPLPVELGLFTARATSRPSVELHWVTASERNCQSFTVERSADGTSFQDVRTVAGAGTVQGPTTYDVADEHPLTSPTFYRLRQRDFDGTTNFSPPLLVVPVRTANAGLAVYPGNSAQDWTVSATLPADVLASGTSTVHVVDLLGRVQHTTCIANGTNSARWDLHLPALASGIYIVRLITTVGIFSQRISL